MIRRRGGGAITCLEPNSLHESRGDSDVCRNRTLRPATPPAAPARDALPASPVVCRTSRIGTHANCGRNEARQRNRDPCRTSRAPPALRRDLRAIFEPDMLEARQRPQYAGNLRCRQFMEPTHHPLKFQQHGHRDERSFGKRRDGARSLFGNLCVVGIIEEEPRRDVRIQRLHGLPRRERISSDAGSKSSDRRGARRTGALTMPASPVMSDVATDRTTRSFSPSDSSSTSMR